MINKILLVVIIVIIVGVVLYDVITLLSEEDKIPKTEPAEKGLSEMSCEELKEELDNPPYVFLSDNERYIENVLKIIELKGCAI